MAFDPDKYLAEKTGGAFDPDKYLQEKTAGRTPASSAEQYSMLDSGIRGAAQGATLSLADELEGAYNSPMGGAKSLLGLLGMDNSSDEDVKAYAAARDKSRGQYEAAEEQNPGSYIGGNILGSMVPGGAIGKLVGPAAKGLSLATDAVGPLNKATGLQNILNATKIGAAGGAAYGLGGSNADLTKGEIVPALNDVAKGGITGGVLGGALQTGLEAGKGAINIVKDAGLGASKLDTVQNLKNSFKYGQEGIDLVSKEGLENAGKELVSGAEDLGALAKEALSRAGKAYGKADDILNASNTSYDVKDKIEIVEKAMMELSESRDPAAAEDLAKLQTVLDNFKLGKTSTVEVSPLKPRTVRASPDARAQLEDEATKAKEAARQLGQNLETNIVESTDDKGRKLLTLVKRTDENIGSGERLVPGEPIATEPEISHVDAPAPGDVVKVKFQTGDNSPESKTKALEKAAKLNSRAKAEGKVADYKVVRDDDHGIYNVIETTKGKPAPIQAPEMIPGEPVLDVDPSLNNKSTATAKTVIQPDAAPDQGAFIPTQPVKQQVRLNPVNLEEAKPKDMRDLINTFNRMSGAKPNTTPELKTNAAINSLKQSAGGIKSQLKATPEYKEANDLYAAGKQAFESMGISADDFQKDALTGKVILTTNARSKLANEIRRSGTDTSAGINSKEKMTRALSLLSKIAPDEVEKLGPELAKKADILDLAQTAQKAKFGSKTSMFESGPVQVGNRLGLSLKNLRERTPQELKDIGNQLLQRGGGAALGATAGAMSDPENAGRNAALGAAAGATLKLSGEARLGKILLELANKDDAGRNAMLFSLEQQPWARELLGKDTK